MHKCKGHDHEEQKDDEMCLDEVEDEHQTIVDYDSEDLDSDNYEDIDYLEEAEDTSPQKENQELFDLWRVSFDYEAELFASTQTDFDMDPADDSQSV